MTHLDHASIVFLYSLAFFILAPLAVCGVFGATEYLRRRRRRQRRRHNKQHDLLRFSAKR